MGVASGYADLSGDLHPLALDEEEDQAGKPCWHPLKRHVFYAGFVVVEALGEKAYQPQTYLGLLKDQALHVLALHSEQDSGLSGLGVSVPEAVIGKGHFSED